MIRFYIQNLEDFDEACEALNSCGVKFELDGGDRIMVEDEFVRMRSVSSTNMTLMLRRSELCCVPTKSVPKNHAHSAVPFSKIKHPASSGATRKTVVC